MGEFDFPSPGFDILVFDGFKSDDLIMRPGKPRSVFWFVSTHIARTLFCMVALLIGANIVAIFLTGFDGGPDWLQASIVLGAPVICLMLSVIYSFQTLRRTATIDQPMRCFLPSVLAFSSLALAVVGEIIFIQFRARALSFNLAATLFGYALVLCIEFGLLTRRGLRKLESRPQPGFPVILTD